MIIFQATPSRLFPVVIESILNQTNIEHNEFHYPYIVKKYEDWLKPNNILAGIPKDSLHVRTNGFLVFTWPGSNSPVVRWDEDLRWQAQRAKNNT